MVGFLFIFCFCFVFKDESVFIVFEEDTNKLKPEKENNDEIRPER